MKKLALALVVVALILGLTLSACQPTPTETFTVTFQWNYQNAPDSGTYKTVTVNKGDKVTKPTDPTREGYTFEGWVTAADGNEAFSFDNAVENDVTAYAKWTKKEQPTPPQPQNLTVNFLFNYDGAPNNGIYKTETVVENEKVAKPADPTREGYEFKGWLTTADGDTAFDFDTAITETTTVYASWEENEPTPPEPTKHVVTFNYNYDGAPNDGVYKTESVTEGQKVAKPADPTRDGYEFKGWMTTADGDTAFDFDTAITETTTVYASWEENEPTPPEPTKYAVTFNYNYDGAPDEGIYKTETVTEGQKVAKPADPARTGYEFKGWMTTADGNTAFDFDTVITAITNIYASWEKLTFTVTFHYNYENAPDDGIYATKTVNYGEQAEQVANIIRSGYLQDGWTTTENGTEQFDLTTAITENTDLYAIWQAVTLNTVTGSDTLSVEHVENLSADFVMGMDASSVISLENSGVKFYDYNGNEADIFKVLAESGINTIRVRIWNDPFDAEGHGYGGGNCDIKTAIAIGRRATSYGMMLMPDFHYSDFWADPGKQQVPKAWAGYTVDQKATAIYEFTKDCLQQLKANGIAVNIVQVGNETTNSICGESNWANRAKLFNAGSRAVREVYNGALVAIHFTNPERSGNYANFAKQLHDNNVDYDVFASSWYPFWHGTLANLQSVLDSVATTYNKKVMVAETSYAYTLDDSDFHDNTVRQGTNSNSSSYGFDFSIQGQADLVRAVINTIANTTNGIGVCYWEGTWIGVGGSSKEENLVLWEQYGSGWASSYAAEYDPDDAGKWYGGSAVDNQALFGADGKPLESLKVFKLVYSGCNEPEYKDVYLSGQTNSWTPEKVAEVDIKNHTVTVTLEITEGQTGSANGFGFTVVNADAPDASTDNQLCWIGGSTNCKVGENLITVTFTDNSGKFVTNASNLYATAAGKYAIVIEFEEDNSTPVSVTIIALQYTINFNGGNSGWKDQAIEGATINSDTHTAEFEMTFTKDSGNFGFTINDPATGAQITWIGGTGNVLVNKVAISTMQIVDESDVMEVSAGSKNRDFHLKYLGTYTFTIEFEDDNVTPKKLTVVAGDDVDIPEPDNPDTTVYAIYFTGNGNSWGHDKIANSEIDLETHTATFTYAFPTTAFGFEVYKADETTFSNSTKKCWIAQDGNIWGATQITGVTFADNTGKFATSGSGNLTASEAGTYKFTIVFGTDNITPVSVTIDNVEASE